MDTERGQDRPSEDALRRRKLELEVAEMEREATGAARRVKGLGSALGVSGALATLLFGIVEFGEREKTRLDQQAAQIEDARRDSEARRSAAFREAFRQLSAGPSKDLSVPQVRYLLFTLAELSEACPATSNCPRESAMVTEQLAYLSTRELDYIASRAASDLDQTFLDLLPAYEAWLRANPDENQVILYKAFQGLRHLAVRYPAYFAEIRTSGEQFLVETYNEDEEAFLHFSSLTRSYQRHVRLLPDDGRRLEAAKSYAEALANAQLAASLFGYAADDLLPPAATAPRLSSHAKVPRKASPAAASVR